MAHFYRKSTFYMECRLSIALAIESRPSIKMSYWMTTFYKIQISMYRCNIYKSITRRSLSRVCVCTGLLTHILVQKCTPQKQITIACLASQIYNCIYIYIYIYIYLIQNACWFTADSSALLIARLAPRDTTSVQSEHKWPEFRKWAQLTWSHSSFPMALNCGAIRELLSFPI